MYKILEKKELAPKIKLFKLQAPLIARKAVPGNFVVLRINEKGERIPLTIADYDRGKGTITVVFQEVGKSTEQLGQLQAGESLADLVGPLGTPLPVAKVGTVVCVGAGVGVAPTYPRARELHELGNRVISIVGARSKEMLIMTREMESVSDEILYSTDDGTFGHHGFVTDVLKQVIDRGEPIAEVLAIGPALMMRAVSNLTRTCGIKTIVSLNALMVDGTGMCGCCRVTVGNEVKFSCVDGPEFDGHLVDFAELVNRQRQFIPQEKKALEAYHAKKEGCQCESA